MVETESCVLKGNIGHEQQVCLDMVPFLHIYHVYVKNSLNT